MKKIICTLIASGLLCICSTAIAHGQKTHKKHNHNGMVTISSHHDVVTTANKLEQLLVAKGMTIFTRINHSAGAKKVGKTLRPTELLIFGNPNIGTVLMQCAQSVGIDLPQKMLVWEDTKGTTHIGYNAPRYIAKRHSITGCNDVIKKVTGALHKFAQLAAQ